MNRLSLLLTLASTVAAAAAQPIIVEFDPAKTSIQFTLDDVLHTVHGSFKLKSGHLQIDPGAKSISGKAVVDATSGDSGSEARDSRMKKNILEVDRYPEIGFEPASLEGFTPGATASSVTVAGWFSIHGQRHWLSIPMQVKVSGNQISATGKFTVPYVAWGMKNPSNFVLRVNQTVDIDIAATGTLAR